jgi:hypothetical protein
MPLLGAPARRLLCAWRRGKSEPTVLAALALIAAGFARYGFKREASRIFEGVFAASTYIDLRRLPELFCGFVRRRAQGPTLYPVEGPVLPDFLGEVTLRNLALDGATVEVALRRSRLQVVVDVLDRRGSVRVVTTS